MSFQAIDRLLQRGQFCFENACNEKCVVFGCSNVSNSIGAKYCATSVHPISFYGKDVHTETKNKEEVD